jgi:splicing factor 3A subunit 2
MVLIRIEDLNESKYFLDVTENCLLDDLKLFISSITETPLGYFKLFDIGSTIDFDFVENTYLTIYDGMAFQMKLSVVGGIDFQHREGSKIGSGGHLSESQAALERKERLRKLALETIDISKDPYFMKNHLGTYECKLCLTLHPNEGNYLAHTQGKRHQSNLGRRAAMEAKNAAPRAVVSKELPKKVAIRIGRPGYKVLLLFYFLFYLFRVIIKYFVVQTIKLINYKCTQ